MFGLGKKNKAPQAEGQDEAAKSAVELPDQAEVDQALDNYAADKTAELEKKAAEAEAEKANAVVDLREHVEQQDAMAGVGAAAVTGAQEAPKEQ